jgi:hypothetical protein
METMKLTLNRLKALCEVDWLDFVIGWSLEGSLDKTVVNAIVEKSGHPDQFLFFFF